MPNLDPKYWGMIDFFHNNSREKDKRVIWETLCKIECQDFVELPNHYNIPGHLSDYAWKLLQYILKETYPDSEIHSVLKGESPYQYTVSEFTKFKKRY